MTTISGYSKPFHMKSAYLNEEAVIALGRSYNDGSPAWQLVDSSTGEPLCTATIRLVDYNRKPKNGYVFIKNYSENAGVYDGLLKAGIIAEAEEWISVGFAADGVAHCKVLWEELL